MHFLLTSRLIVLLFHKEIYTNNYEIEVFNSIVYLVGIARNPEEHVLLEDKIRKFSGVKKLISFVKKLKEIR